MTWKQYAALLFSDLFLASLFLYTGILFVELQWKGVVAQHINTAYLFGAIAVTGVCALLFPAVEQKSSRWIPIAVSFFAGTYIGSRVTLETQSIGLWAYFFGICAGVITFACGVLLAKPHPPDGGF